MCEKRPGPVLCSTQRVPASCKAPPQQTAELISQAGWSSVNKYLRKDKNGGDKKKKVGDATLWTPRSEKKRRREVFQASKHRFPCSPVERITLKHISTLHPTKDPMPEEVDIS